MRAPHAARRLVACIAAGALLVGCAANGDDELTAEPSSSAADDATQPVEPTDGATTSSSSDDGSKSTTEAPAASLTPLQEPTFETFALPAGSRPHDIAPDPDGGFAWYVGQDAGNVGRLDPTTGDVALVDLGPGSRPHGIVVGPDGGVWVTDGGRDAIALVDAESLDVTEFPLPVEDANLNTAAFDADGRLWFTGQAGVYGSVDPSTGEVDVHESPRGSGPYGADATPDGVVWFASLVGSYIARVEDAEGTLSVFDVPTSGGGARRVWSDSAGDLWVTEWFVGKLARFDPDTATWDEWDLPTSGAQPYAVFVDDRDHVWVTDFATNALLRFDPTTEQFTSFEFPSPDARVRQLLGRPGEVWGVGSNVDEAYVLRTAAP